MTVMELSARLGKSVNELKVILEITPGDLQPAPALDADIRTDFIQATGRVEEAFKILLDFDNLLSAEGLASLQQLSEAGKCCYPGRMNL